MITKVQKWGNSLAVRLPKEMAMELSLKEGSDVEFLPEADSLIIKRIRKQPLTLRDLLAKVKTRDPHGEIDWGKPVGKEVW